MLLCFRLRRIRILRQELGDTEVEQLRFAFCVRQNVARFDVAMNNHVAMRKLHRGTDL